jgi:predicted O-methyltransferase YrrM
MGGVDLVRRNFYSPVPDVERLPSDTFARRSSMRGIELDLDACVGFLQGLERELGEFEPPPGFVWDNRMYGRVEADVLYAVVRHRHPRRVIELGSGFSSLIIAAALRRNEDDGHHGSYTAYDPYARDFVRRGVDGLSLETISAADVSPSEFEALEQGDVLFIDTSHIVKVGSEVNHLILDVLPTITAGVLIHIHDIFLPYEYPKDFFEKGLYFNEQYLFQAFLTENPGWEILAPLYALSRDRPQELARLIGSYTPSVGPGAFWFWRRPESE